MTLLHERGDRSCSGACGIRFRPIWWARLTFCLRPLRLAVHDARRWTPSGPVSSVREGHMAHGGCFLLLVCLHPLEAKEMGAGHSIVRDDEGGSRPRRATAAAAGAPGPQWQGGPCGRPPAPEAARRGGGAAQQRRRAGAAGCAAGSTKQPQPTKGRATAARRACQRPSAAPACDRAPGSQGQRHLDAGRLVVKRYTGHPQPGVAEVDLVRDGLSSLGGALTKAAQRGWCKCLSFLSPFLTTGTAAEV